MRSMEAMQMAGATAHAAGYEEGRKEIDLIAAICGVMNANGHAHTPRIALRSEFDLSKFSERQSDVPGIGVEYVDQSGPGMVDDEFYGTMAFPIGDRLFVIDYN